MKFFILLRRLRALLFCLNHAARNVLAFALASLVFPQSCLLCGKTIVRGQLCSRCREKTLDAYGGKNEDFEAYGIPCGRCLKCGKELVSEKDLCTTCRSKPVLVLVDSVFPLYPYRFWAKDLLFFWKTQNNRRLSPLFAQKLYLIWRKYYNGIPVIPVPPRPGKIRKKGWDQIEELVAFLEYRYRVPVMRLLYRTTAKQQKKLNRTERLQNSPFRLKKNVPGHFSGGLPGEALILDDIMTTGATLENCARELKAAGIKKIRALTLFIVE